MGNTLNDNSVNHHPSDCDTCILAEKCEIKKEIEANGIKPYFCKYVIRKKQPI
jgi:hypothetical protein